MQDSTSTIIQAALKADPTLNERIRRRLLEAIHNVSDDSDAQPLILRSREAARILGCTVRTLQNYRRAGQLTPVRFPGRNRSFGYRKSEIYALANGEG